MKHNFQLSNALNRGLWASLSTIEEILLEFENLLEPDHSNKSIFIEIKSNIDFNKIETIKKEIEGIKDILNHIKYTFNLKKETINNTPLLLSRCANMWEILCDLESKKLKRYGQPSEEVSNYLDPIIHQLIEKIETIREIINKK